MEIGEMTNAQSHPSSHKLDFSFFRLLKLLPSAKNLLGKFSVYD